MKGRSDPNVVSSIPALSSSGSPNDQHPARPHIVLAGDLLAGDRQHLLTSSTVSDGEQLRVVIMHLLSTLMLSPNRGVSHFAESLLKSERGIKFDSSVADVEVAGAAQMWSVMKVMHDFSALQGHDHLSITKGDAVAVQFVGQRGWSYGRVVMDHAGRLVPDSTAGWFPSAYARAMHDESSAHTNADARPTGFVTAVESNQHYSSTERLAQHCSSVPEKSLQYGRKAAVAGCWAVS